MRPRSPPPSAGEVRALAHQLLSWADHLSTRLARGRLELSEEDQHDLLITVAEAMRGTRRVRSRIFPDVPLGNANWAVLLDLFIRELNGHLLYAVPEGEYASAATWLAWE